MFRYSLFTLLAAVLGVALFCAALANATVLWRDGVKLGLWLFLLTSLVAAIASRERVRAIASGMAVFGFGFFFFLERSAPEFIDSGIEWTFVSVHGPRPELVDDEGGARPANTIQEFMRQPRPGNGILDDRIPDDMTYEMRKSYDTRKECFVLIAHAELTMLISLLGGGLGMIFYTRSEHRDANKTPS